MSELETYTVDIIASRRYRMSAKMLKISGGKRDKTSPRWHIRPADHDAFMDLGCIVFWGGIVTDSAGQDVSTDRLFMLARQQPQADWVGDAITQVVPSALVMPETGNEPA